MSSTITIDHRQIHQRAYARWQERGCPVGSPDHDWFEAEQELVREREALEAASAKLVAVVNALPPVSAKPAEKKASSRTRAPRGRITSPLTLNAETVEAEPQSKVHARAAAIPRPSKRRKVAR
jgi:hypothetical protein